MIAEFRGVITADEIGRVDLDHGDPGEGAIPASSRRLKRNFHSPSPGFSTDG